MMEPFKTVLTKKGCHAVPLTEDMNTFSKTKPNQLETASI